MPIAGVVSDSFGGREIEFVCSEKETELLVFDNGGFGKLFEHKITIWNI
jgi:hypothetical protein